MYPSGIGTSFADPRRSNFTKSQSLGYDSGRRTAKDFAETTSNAAPHPTDPLGTNLRRGKGLSFSKGIAQFDGYIKGNSVQDNTNAAFAPPGPSYAPPPHVSKRPTFRNMSAGSRSSFQHPGDGDYSARPQSGQVSFRPGSARFAPEPPLGSGENSMQDSARGLQDSARGSARGMDSARGMQDSARGMQDSARGMQYSSRPGTSGHVSGGRFRPHSAPVKRPEIRQEDLPTWARDQLFAPSWAKTVENQKARPSSARIRQQGLPLSTIPKWISLDNKMLSFEAFFKEAVEESRQERSRVRRCVVQYFLEDDTMKISEPREENSGIPQGSFLKRHKVPKDGGGFVTWRDIQVPGDLHVYRRTFRVTKCDAFTRDFLARAGVEVLEEGVPMDDVHLARSRPASGRPTSAGSVKSWAGDTMAFYGRQKNDMSEYIEAKLGKCQDRKENVTKYLDNDRKVLRFYCSWDEKSPDGVVEKRAFVLHFFLADDTVEVLEVNRPNSGRDPFPALLKRMKLPRGHADAGVTAGASNNKPVFVMATDLRVGGVVSVFGRQMEINDCDEATARYYREEHGVQWAARHRGRAPASAGPRRGVLVPPHNGFGAEEDSRQNCMSLHPKPPKVNVIRLLENKGKLLRFVGKLEHAVGFDVERVFTISYFLDTDELAIFEPPVKNSGRTGGKFMERCKVRKPRSSDYYSEADLYLGARIGVYSRRFVLVDADEFTVKYMEQHPQVFPASDVHRISEKLQRADLEQVGAALRARDKLGSGEIRTDDLKAVLRAVGASNPQALQLNDQEVHTLCRALGARAGTVRYEGLLSGEALGPARGEGAGRAPKTVTMASSSGDAALDDAIQKLQALLYRRGPLGLKGLERGLEHISRGAGAVDRADLDTVLGFCGVTLGEEEASTIFRALDRGDAVIGCAELVHAIRPTLSGAMEAAVREVFDTLEDPTFKTGAVEMDEVLARYRPGRHLRVMEGQMTEGDAARELEDGLEGVQGAVMAKDLIAFYADVVAGYQLDENQLLDMLRGTWGLSGRN